MTTKSWVKLRGTDRQVEWARDVRWLKLPTLLDTLGADSPHEPVNR